MTRVQWQSSLAVLCVALVVIAALLNPHRFSGAYLAAFLFCLGLSLGSMANLMLHELTGGHWGVALREPWMGATRLLPLTTALFLPLLFAAPHLYPWIESPTPETHAKAWWLNVPFVIVRVAIYFLVWNLLARRWLTIATRSNTPRPPALRRLSAAGLIVYGLTISLAAVDWIMSLMPQWYSTAFGLLIVISQMLSGMAVAVVARTHLHPAELQPTTLNDFGNLLLTYVMTWAYVAFTQFLIIWAEDLPHEIAWYVPRVQTSWRWLTVTVFLLLFAIPFALLLFRVVKRTPEALGALAAMLLVGQLLFCFYLVIPTLLPGGATASLSDALTFVGVVGVWAIAWLRTLDEPDEHAGWRWLTGRRLRESS
jgi:hypothetical protein